MTEESIAIEVLVTRCFWCSLERKFDNKPAVWQMEASQNCDRHSDNVKASKDVFFPILPAQEASQSSSPILHGQNACPGALALVLLVVGLLCSSGEAATASKPDGNSSLIRNEPPRLGMASVNLRGEGLIGNLADSTGGSAFKSHQEASAVGSTPAAPTNLPLRGIAGSAALPSQRMTRDAMRLEVVTSPALYPELQQSVCSPTVGTNAALENFLDKMELVESAGLATALGDHGRSRGPFQFSLGAWCDVSRARLQRHITGCNRVLDTRPYSFSINRYWARLYAKEYLSIVCCGLARNLHHPPSWQQVVCAWQMGATGFARIGYRVELAPLTTRRAIERMESL